jgi:hypothetical protein
MKKIFAFALAAAALVAVWTTVPANAFEQQYLKSYSDCFIIREIRVQQYSSYRTSAHYAEDMITYEWSGILKSDSHYLMRGVMTHGLEGNEKYYSEETYKDKRLARVAVAICKDLDYQQERSRARKEGTIDMGAEK